MDITAVHILTIRNGIPPRKNSSIVKTPFNLGSAKIANTG